MAQNEKWPKTAKIGKKLKFFGGFFLTWPNPITYQKIRSYAVKKKKSIFDHFPPVRSLAIGPSYKISHILIFN